MRVGDELGQSLGELTMLSRACPELTTVGFFSGRRHSGRKPARWFQERAARSRVLFR